MKVTINHKGNQVTGDLIEKNDKTTTIAVFVIKTGGWKQIKVPNSQVVATETETIKETATALNRLFGVK